ncbi:NAD(P)/FAD-dependent oxidoreductase [Cryobacterium melibiosiphilum]|uniref:NAD(P)/FAD-dependent oxidoreductase n=1 Tax=Cryobacterium melibiosiphilum TaxID=995039 RepID=A0A3A5MWU3_9MICO|nr:FAD-dependent oxidoreductase [Cryobacterium melibiosiphilum]RJT91773.1 NAD(P)/FAD-dependent oxidoreductase [Cryobacterium melibiosiphilum]
MPDSQSFIIVGAGLAGASAARTLREEGFTGPIQLIGAEAHRPYIRPPLSKDYLNGSGDDDSIYVDPKEWYAEHHVDLLLGTSVTRIDANRRLIHTDAGDTFSYRKVLLTTGSSSRRLSILGADLEGVHYLRTVEDSKKLRSLLAGGNMRLVLIGSGWIGMEVAATARTLGNDVTILERGPIPLANALGDELGQMFADLHEQNGVILRRSVSVESILGHDGRTTAVRLTSGEVIPADLVLVGIGATPNVELADSAGLTIDNGVSVDASLRTSDPAIYAAGDVANAYHPVAKLQLRSEHWANALNGGKAAARSMLGQNMSYDDIPYFYTDQFDIGMEYSGFGPLARGADVVYRGDRAGREFIAFWVTGGKVVAGMNVNIWDVNEAVQGIIRRGNQVDHAKLANADVPLESL